MRRGLWRDHPATAQQQLLFRKRQCNGRPRQPTQADLLIAMLREARAQGRPLELPQIMKAGIAQHGARFVEIRARGFVVKNETTRDGDRVRSHYWLTFDPERDGER